jgi:microcystin-dependent protein
MPYLCGTIYRFQRPLEKPTTCDRAEQSHECYAFAVWLVLSLINQFLIFSLLNVHIIMDPFIGQICLFGFNYAPVGWMACNGQLLPIAQNSALFALLGTTYGGDGRTTFAVPDLRGRVAVGQGNGPGLSPVAIGQMAGTSAVTLTINQIPAHQHPTTVTINAGADANLTNVATGRALASEVRSPSAPPLMYTDSANGTILRADAATVTTGVIGGSQAHDNMQPYLGLNYCISLQGIFPPRN